MKVRQVLTSHVAVATRQEPLLDAIRRMREEHVGALIVVAADAGAAGQGVRRPIGMLTDRDIVVGVFAKDGAHVATLEVGDVMTEDLVTATADEDVGEVLRRMRSFGVRRVPVVDDAGGLEGVLSVDDAVTGLSEELSEIAALVSRQQMREPARRP